MARSLPNIIITGTPGTGKTTHCEDLAEKVPELRHLSVNQIVKDRECHEGWDEDYQSWIVDEDKVCLYTSPSLEREREVTNECICKIIVASRCYRRGVQSWRLHNRLACM